MDSICIFPDQGVSCKNELQKLYSNSHLAREAVRKATDFLGVCLTEDRNYPEAKELAGPPLEQLRTFVYCLALHEIQIIKGGGPFKVAYTGYSLGEFVAAVASKALSFGDGLRLVRARGLAMKQTAGKEEAVVLIDGVNSKEVDDYCRHVSKKKADEVWVSHFNHPDQTIISGHKKAVLKVVRSLAERSWVKIKQLNKVRACHCPTMAEAEKSLTDTIEHITFTTPRQGPLYLDGNRAEVPSEVKFALKSQLSKPVRWEKTTELIKKDGFTRIILVGPPPIPTFLSSNGLSDLSIKVITHFED